MCGVIVLGYVLEKLDCAPGPLVLGLVLGPLLEENLRRSLLISRGDPTVFLTRPISGGILLFTLLLLIAFTLPAFTRRKDSLIGTATAHVGGEAD